MTTISENLDLWDRRTMFRVYYTYWKGTSGEAFFTEREAAELFAEALRKTHDKLLVSVSKWTWQTAIEP